MPAATDQKLAWLREAAGARFDDLEIQTLLGFVHVTDDARGIARGDRGLVRRVGRRRAARAGDARRHATTSIVELLERRRERWQMSYIVVPDEAIGRVRAGRRAPGGNVEEDVDDQAVPVRSAGRRSATSASAWRDKARKLEDLGYSTLFMPDHFGEELAPMPAIAMAAAHTTTLRVGALVFDNDYKHPAILAKEAATIDLLSDGRLELGIGAGWMKTDYDALGLPYDPPAVRVDRFEEALHVIKQCFTGEKFTLSRRALPDHRLRVVPEARAGASLPILVGGGGKRVLSIAAREADIVGINPNLRAGEIGLDAATDSLQEQTDRRSVDPRRRGPRIDDIEIQMRFFVCKRHRRPHEAGRGAGARLRRVARRGAGVGRGAGRHRDRDHRAAAPAAASGGACRT